MVFGYKQYNTKSVETAFNTFNATFLQTLLEQRFGQSDISKEFISLSIETYQLF